MNASLCKKSRLILLCVLALLCTLATVLLMGLCRPHPAVGLLCALSFLLTLACLAPSPAFSAHPNLLVQGKTRFALWGGSAVALSAFCALFYSGALLRAMPLIHIAPLFHATTVFWRALVLLPPCLLITSFAFFSAKTVGDFLFRYRYPLALSLFVLCVAGKLNFSSVSYYHTAIESGSATPFTFPLFGMPRGIRGDEWLVDLPRYFSAEYTDYQKINDIVRGTQNQSISSSYLYLGYSALANPFRFGYYLFGSQYGLSFFWCGMMIASFLVSFEFSRLLTGDRRLISLLGGVMIGYSAFSMWWSICTYLISVQGALLCIYYFLHAKKRLHRVGYAVGVSLFGAMYICNLYPAWQVPLGFIALAFLVWVCIDSFDRLKALRLWDWIIVLCALLFLGSVVLAYLSDSRSYMEAVMSTSYPGARFSSGGYALSKLLLYFQTPLYPFVNVGNSCEASCFFSLFPLPMLFALYQVIRQIRAKRHDPSVRPDVLTLCLLVPTLFLTLYCSVGIGAPLARLTLMGYSTPERAVDFLGLLQVYLLLRTLSYKKEERPTAKVALPVIVLFLALAIFTCYRRFPDYLPLWYLLPATVGILAFAYVWLCRQGDSLHTAGVLSLCAVLCISGLSVNPVNRGTDALTKKPLSYAIREIVATDPDAVWVSQGAYTGQYLIANGAPCITSVNYIPNLELWQKLDPAGTYYEIYNRYCHINCTFTTESTSSFSLITPDSVQLNLSYSDFQTAGITYILSPVAVEEEGDLFALTLRYQSQAGSYYIYQIHYL